MEVRLKLRHTCVMRIALFTFLLLGCTLVTAEDTDKMVTDRPSFRNSARLIAPGVVQLETGWHLHDDRAPAESNLFGAEPARYGSVLPHG